MRLKVARSMDSKHTWPLKPPSWEAQGVRHTISSLVATGHHARSTWSIQNQGQFTKVIASLESVLTGFSWGIIRKTHMKRMTSNRMVQCSICINSSENHMILEMSRMSHAVCLSCIIFLCLFFPGLMDCCLMDHHDRIWWLLSNLWCHDLGVKKDQRWRPQTLTKHSEGLLVPIKTPSRTGPDCRLSLPDPHRRYRNVLRLPLREARINPANRKTSSTPRLNTSLVWWWHLLTTMLRPQEFTSNL